MRSFDEMIGTRSGELSGNALYKQIVKDAVEEAIVLRSVNDPIGCFLAGTMVKTKNGLVPIESIKVGDFVLSQPEDQGERAYKRVLNTFNFDDKQVWSVDLIVGVDENALEGLVVTGNHPFWVKGMGWTRVDHLFQSAVLELSDGREAEVFCIKPVFKSGIEGIGYIQDGTGAGGRDCEEGALLDLRNGYKQRSHIEPSVPQPYGYADEDALLKTRVYNFEVEDFHTYYVGRLGVWVHNSTTCIAESIASEIRLGSAGQVIPLRNLPVFSAKQVDQLVGPHRGVIREIETTTTSAASTQFERETFGFRSDPATGLSAPVSYRFENRYVGEAGGPGRNVIRAGDCFQ